MNLPGHDRVVLVVLVRMRVYQVGAGSVGLARAGGADDVEASWGVTRAGSTGCARTGCGVG